MSGLGSGFVNLFKSWGRGIGNAADKLLLGADARKAISDEVRSKFKPKIDLAREAENKRADNIKDLGDRLAESKANWQKAKDKWQQDYDAALAGAKNQRQTDINDYDTKLKGYQGVLDNAKAGRQSILDQLSDSEASYNPTKTIFTDVNTGENYIFNPFNGGYRSLNSLKKKERNKFLDNYENFDTRLFDIKTNRVLNPFDKSTRNTYKGYSVFDNYYSNRISTQNAALRDADNQIKQANNDLRAWSKNNNRPADWDDQIDSGNFEKDFRANNAEPTGYSFNGKNYSDETALDAAYQKALAHEQALQNSASKSASRYISDQNTAIAKRIQDAKDIKKAKLALGALGVGAGAGALYAGAKALYGGDDTPDNTDNIDNTNNIDNTDNTYTGEPDPNLKIENTPEGKAALNGKSIFDPDKADALTAAATLAAAAHDTGVEDSNSIESSDDHFIDDDELYGLLKAMKDPYKADAVANYIYSKHGNESDVQNLGWRGWLNKYYGDLLRSRMNIDPSGYKGMHISGGL